MNPILKQINTEFYKLYDLNLTNYKEEPESREYYACRFNLNKMNIISRNARITPKKIGQFVTLWKRHKKGPIEPFQESDSFHFYVVNVQQDDKLGQFVFPKSILIKKGIISTPHKEGKRALRVYPIWDKAINKTAQNTQKWQLEYFYNITPRTNFNEVISLFKNP